MANVAFKRGLSSNLPLNNAIDGVFYLTTDTNRLYVGKGTSLVDLNRYIITVQNTSFLPAAPHLNDFAWSSEENMLLVCTKESPSEGLKQWTQINPDTNDNDDTAVTGVSTPEVVATKDGGVQVSFKIQQKKEKKTSGKLIATDDLADIPVSFTISGADIATANNIAVGVNAAAIADGAKITTAGDGSDNGATSFNIKGSGAASVSVSNGDVIVSAVDTTYGIEATTNSNKAQIVLTSNVGDDAITVESANDAIAIAAAADVVTVTHKDYGSIAATSTTAKETLSHGDTFKVIDSITTDKGHVTKVNVKEVVLPADENTVSELSVVDSGDNAIIRLTEKNGTTSVGDMDVQLVAGTDIVIDANETADSISIAHNAYSTTVEAKASANVSASAGDTITVVDSVNAVNGHVTKVYTKEITLPADHNTVLTETGSNLVADNAGNLKLTLKDSDSNTYEIEAEKAFFFTVGDDDNKKTVYNQGDLDVYTRGEIDTMVAGVNAMSYKGTVGSGGNFAALPSENVKIGDTYMAYAAGNYGGHAAGVGDLLIATGAEGADGYIAKDAVVWTYVPSGNDTDTQYQLKVANNVVSLYNTVTKDNDGTLEIVEGNDIKVSTNDGKITIKHEDYTYTPASNDSVANIDKKFKVLDTITTDNGHVTNVTFKELTLPTDHNDTYTIGLNANHTIALDGTDQQTEVIFANDDYITLTDNVNADTLTIGHKAYSASLAATTGAKVNVADNGNKFVAVTGVTRDAGGHLTGFTTQEFSVTDENTLYELELLDNHRINLASDIGDTYVDLASANEFITLTDSDAKITFAHKDYVAGNPATAGAALAPAHGESFTVVTAVTRDAGGHMTGYTTQQVTLPADVNTTYDLAAEVVAATVSDKSGVNFKSTLSPSDKSGDDVTNFNLVSSSLTVTKVSNEAASIELEWGSFDN